MISVKSPPLSHHNHHARLTTTKHHRRRHTHLKLLCLFNDAFTSDAGDPVRYTGGDTKLVSVDRPIAFSKIISKINSLSPATSSSYVINYQLGSASPISCLDSDVRRAVDGFDRLRNIGLYIERRKRMILAMDAAFGMEYLHEKSIVHFDLKSHNFLVNMKDPQRPVCKVDVYSFGIVMWELLTGGIINSDFRPEIPSWCDPTWRDAGHLIRTIDQ